MHYCAEPAEVIAAHDFTGHFYTDDSQMYITHISVPAADAARRLSACIVSVESWMSSHCLKMNPGQDSATVDWDVPAAVQGHCQRCHTIHGIAMIFISRVEPWCSLRHTTQYG